MMNLISLDIGLCGIKADFVLEMLTSVFKMLNFVLQMLDFVFK